MKKLSLTLLLLALFAGQTLAGTNYKTTLLVSVNKANTRDTGIQTGVTNAYDTLSVLELVTGHVTLSKSCFVQAKVSSAVSYDFDKEAPYFGVLNVELVGCKQAIQAYVGKMNKDRRVTIYSNSKLEPLPAISASNR